MQLEKQRKQLSSSMLSQIGNCLHAGKRQISVLDKLSSHDYKTALFRARKQRHGSTGRWPVQTKQFVEWADGFTTAALWCTGKLGFGKTVLTGYAVEYLSAKHSQTHEKVTYFLCQYGNEASLQASTILRCLIKQCLHQDEKLSTKIAAQLEDTLNDDPDDLEKLTLLLLKILENGLRVFLIIDGLDECSNTEMKATLKVFRNIVRQNASGLKLYLAGDDRISDLIVSDLPSSHVVDTHSPEAGSDFQELVGQLMLTKRDDGDLVIGYDQLFSKIQNVLTNEAQGMYVRLSY